MGKDALHLETVLGLLGHHSHGLVVQRVLVSSSCYYGVAGDALGQGVGFEDEVLS